jgi:hypothetical protein
LEEVRKESVLCGENERMRPLATDDKEGEEFFQTAFLSTLDFTKLYEKQALQEALWTAFPVVVRNQTHTPKPPEKGGRRRLHMDESREHQ